ncbi:hypothetical protein [Ochrobactrum soli]|uniref:Uncharacterized protein n=1 Tax=Ochrobactrum soli TaxID=2448455 RepID=A0A2P9HKT5_9HYPH|nr:hypothetical protein [[Ochrobactrum] soli]SPL64420.1 hypothetical protein OHAE_287 [[Ochrobactrum] soli]
MNNEQIAWAARHDWFVADLGNGTVLVLDCYRVNGAPHEAEITFADFRALRVWAGY